MALVPKWFYYLHCKSLQGITGALQGYRATGISYLQGYHWYKISNKYYCHFTEIIHGKLLQNTAPLSGTGFKFEN